MKNRITLNEVLSMKYLNGFEWSPDSTKLVYKWNDGGITDAWQVCASGKEEPRKFTEAKSGVSVVKWSSLGALAMIIDGNLVIYNSELNSEEQVTTEGGYFSKIDWSPNGTILAFTDGKLLSFYNMQTKKIFRFKPLGDVFAGRFSQTVGNDSFNWSISGSKFMYTFLDKHLKPYLAIVDSEGNHLWTSSGHNRMIGEGCWVDDNRFVYSLRGRFGSKIEYYLATIPAEDLWQSYSHINAVSRFIVKKDLILRASVKDEKGAFLCNITPVNDRQLLFGLETEGYFHHYLFDIASKKLTQLTTGQCEDFAQMGDKISLSPDRKQFVFSSNRAHRIERQLYIYNLENKKFKQITDLPVTNTLPLWSPNGKKIAYLHADKRKNGDLWVYDLECEQNYQLTDSMPEGLADKIQESELISYKGAENWDIDAFLYKPADFDPNKKYPAIVWVHGGPVRQMRGSWHPSATYSHFYIFNQFLVSQGYIVLSPNFRGGIGYGSEFRYGLYLKKGVNDTIDIVNGGKYLKELPYVDEAKVAVYGLSYGGYMTLHSLTQYPDEFTAGINLAGLWDIAQWARWMKDKYENYRGDAYFGGNIEERPDLWSLGSPVTYKENLCKPLMSLQGTADPNVDFNQLNSLVKDLTKMGAEHEAIYYPDEMHTFRWRHTWYDALPRMVAFFDQHLKG